MCLPVAVLHLFMVFNISFVFLFVVVVWVFGVVFIFFMAFYYLYGVT